MTCCADYWLGQFRSRMSPAVPQMLLEKGSTCGKLSMLVNNNKEEAYILNAPLTSSLPSFAGVGFPPLRTRQRILHEQSVQVSISAKRARVVVSGTTWRDVSTEIIEAGILTSAFSTHGEEKLRAMIEAVALSSTHLPKEASGCALAGAGAGVPTEP